jgi:hypothetical protein
MKEIHPEIISRIAEMIDCGLVCYLNPDTLELAEIPAWVLDGMFDADDKLFKQDLLRMEVLNKHFPYDE